MTTLDHKSHQWDFIQEERQLILRWTARARRQRGWWAVGATSRGRRPADGPTIARIIIPAIGVRAPMIKLGLNRDKSLQVPADVRKTGWWAGGAGAPKERPSKPLTTRTAEMDALLEAGIERADAFVASTHGDNTNLVIAQVAQRRFQVPTVVVRVLDPARAEWYRQKGLVTVCPTQTAIDLLLETVGEDPLGERGGTPQEVG